MQSWQQLAPVLICNKRAAQRLWDPVAVVGSCGGGGGGFGHQRELHANALEAHTFTKNLHAKLPHFAVHFVDIFYSVIS